MNRARVILAPLLPALWLVVSVNALFDPVAVGAEQPYRSALCSRNRPGHDLPNSGCSLDQSTRRWSRRLDEQSGPGVPPPLVYARLQAAGLQPVSLSLAQPPSLLALAQSWQFHWRTAAEPRAPSFVS